MQEILGALSYYGCAQGLVVTNSTFTHNAQQLASKDPRVTLLDRSWLEKQIIKYFPPEIPEFNWDEFRELTRAIQARLAAGTTSTRTSRSYHRKYHGSRRRYR